MSDYIVTARKWRPMKFDDVIGQSHVTVTLRNALATKHLAHAYLFSGPRGVGKTTVARLLAKAVNCLDPKENNPDNECEICKEITEGRSFDVLEIDGASNRGVEEIRNLREAVRYPPAKGKYKVYIIDEVHMLTKEAFNALLKTLEEPPTHVLFIFATTELHKVPPTIVSRCQRFAFRRITVAEMVGNLKSIATLEGVQIDDDALLLIAKKGDGSLRDAQSIFDQVVSLCGRQISHVEILDALNIVDQDVYFRVTDLIKAKDAKGGLALVDGLMNSGHDIKEFLGGLAEHLRNILIAKTTSSTELIEASDIHKKRYAEEAQAFSVADLLRLQRLVNGTENAIRWSSQPRFKLEADMVQMISMPSAAVVGELVQRLNELKEQFGESIREPSDSSGPPAPTYSKIGANPAPPRFASMSAPAPKPPASHGVGSAVSPQTGMPSAEEAPPAQVREGELAARWTEIIGEVRKQRISLASVLESAKLLGIQGGAVRIGCADDFQASSIKRNKDLLVDTLHRLFSVRMRVEVEVHTDIPQPSSSGKETPPGSQKPSEEEHPVIKAMRRELGAEPV